MEVIPEIKVVRIKVKIARCPKCNFEWKPKRDKPVECPNCHRLFSWRKV
jgi:ssDNA-binding Zn-finger/Zn-ribbon topoisomerase 1